MSRYSRENIYPRELEYSFISLISYKIDVLIIGGGKAGLIKAKSFVDRGCKVTVISKEFCKEFQHIKSDNLLVIEGVYEKKLILDKHLIVIAVKDDELIKRIIEDSNKLSKLYLNCKDFKEGNFVVPVQRNTENICFSLNTKAGSPKSSLFLADKLKETLKDYDDFINFVCELRNKLKGHRNKEEILNFVNSDDFKYFYTKGYEKLILNIFYGDMSD